MKTSLHLLASDAVVNVRFSTLLTTQQYGELLLAASRGSTAEGLGEELAVLGKRWGIDVTVTRMKQGTILN